VCYDNANRVKWASSGATTIPGPSFPEILRAWLPGGKREDEPMRDTDRIKLLHGPYHAPRCRVGRRLTCEVRGEVVVCGLTDARIPWPVGKKDRARSLVVCGGLAKAVRRESAIAVCFWWGITPQTVTKWRKALGVPQVNEGTARLYVAYAPERLTPAVQERARARANSPEANAKKAAAKRGKPRPAHVVEALRRAHTGRKLSAEHRAKISAVLRRDGHRPPVGKVWEPWEPDLLGTFPDGDVARRTGRTDCAVRKSAAR
jgi:hypothetical protein